MRSSKLTKPTSPETVSLTIRWSQAVNSQNALKQNLSRTLSQAAGLSLRREQMPTRSRLRGKGQQGPEEAAATRLTFLTSGATVLQGGRALSGIHSTQRVKPHRSVPRGKEHQRSKRSDYAQENPFAERRQQIPGRLKGPHFLHLRDCNE